MEYRFVQSGEGLVDVVLTSGESILARALADSVGTRPPRGAPQDGPSTYWIDRTLSNLRARLEDRDGTAIASGNSTYLALQDGAIEARYDDDPPGSQVVDRVAAHELIDLLEGWRARVIELDPAAERRVPTTLRTRSTPPG